MLKALGFDDGYFPYKFKGMRGKTVVSCVLTLNTRPGQVTPYTVHSMKVYVDQPEVTIEAYETCSKCLKEAEGIESKAILLLDGITYAGFSVLNVDKLYSLLKIPIITIFLYDLELDKIKSALRKHFEDWSFRYKIISTVYSSSERIETPKEMLRIYAKGLTLREAINIVISTQVHSRTPEPLRIAHLSASAISRALITKYLR